MGISFTDWTPWRFETSEETSVTIGLSGASGALYFKNEDTGEDLKLSYHAVSIGAGKGPSVGAAWSKLSDPSGGFGNVAAVRGRHFGPLSFPCRGYILGFGGSASIAPKVVGASDQTAGGITIVLFGIWPVFAGVKLWGTANSLLPGVGASAGIASFVEGDW
jgi:hypothetical protein